MGPEQWQTLSVWLAGMAVHPGSKTFMHQTSETAGVTGNFVHAS